MVSLSEIDKENPTYSDSLYENADEYNTIENSLCISTNIPLSVYPAKHESTRLSFYKFGAANRRLSNSCGRQSTSIGGKEDWSLSDMVKKGRIK